MFSKYQQPSVVGCVSLLLCATITAISAFHAEAILEIEPSLRGLVHVGVMVLFAWICVEPHFTSQTLTTTAIIMTNGIVRDGTRGSLQQQQQQSLYPILTDSQGIGIAFAGCGCFFLAMFPFIMSISRLLQKDIPMTSNYFAIFIASCSIFLFLLSFRTLSPILLGPNGNTRSFVTLALFLLGSAISLCDTLIGMQLPYCLSGGCHNNNLSKELESYHQAWSILILDYMAYVFHRAFIASLLVGAGLGPSNVATTYTRSVDYHPVGYTTGTKQIARRLDFRCRYRATFSLIAMNLGLSWIFGGLFDSSFTNTDNIMIDQGLQQTNIFHHLFRYKGILHVVGGGLVFSAGMLQIDEIMSFRDRNFALPWSWNLPSISSKNMWKALPGAKNRKFEGSGEIICLLSFAFYAGTLFADGVVLRRDETNGFDGCLIRAVHVAAVFAAMVGIFPRLLRAKSSLDAVQNNARFGYWTRRNNVIIKITITSMSIIDALICCWLILRKTRGIGHSKTDVTVLSLSFRMIGAFLQASSYSALEVKSNFSMHAFSDCEEFDHGGECEKERSILKNIDGKPKEYNFRATRDHYDTTTETQMLAKDSKNDIISIISWLIYLCVHIWHSFENCDYKVTRGSTMVTRNIQQPHHAVVFPAEVQLSKIFHFQLVTLGFASTSIFQGDEASSDITIIFLGLEMAGVLACGAFTSTVPAFSFAGNKWHIAIACAVLFLDCMRRKVYYAENSHLDIVALEKKDLKTGVGDTLFSS